MFGGGIPCPVCRNPLGLTIEFIMENPTSKCPQCETVLTFPRNEELYKQFKEAQAEIEKYKKQIKSFM